VIERRSFAAVVSKYGDSNKPPRNQRALKLPMLVRTGRAVWTKARQMPGALSLKRMALRMPGPHHSFSVDTPTLSGPSRAAAVD
jgi:hypothetical protein